MYLLTLLYLLTLDLFMLYLQYFCCVCVIYACISSLTSNLIPCGKFFVGLRRESASSPSGQLLVISTSLTQLLTLVQMLSVLRRFEVELWLCSFRGCWNRGCGLGIFCLCYYICLIEYIDCSVCHGRREATQSLRIICAAQSTKDWREPFSSVLVSWKHRGPLPGPNPVVVLRKAGAVAVAVVVVGLQDTEWVHIHRYTCSQNRKNCCRNQQTSRSTQTTFVGLGSMALFVFFPQFLTKLCLSSLTHGHAQVFFEVLSFDVEMLSVSCVTTMSPPAVFASRSLLIPFLMLPALHWSEWFRM